MAPLIIGILAFIAAAEPYVQDVGTAVTVAKGVVSVPCIVIGMVDPPAPSWCGSVVSAPKAGAMAPHHQPPAMPAYVPHYAPLR